MAEAKSALPPVKRPGSSGGKGFKFDLEESDDDLAYDEVDVEEDDEFEDLLLDDHDLDLETTLKTIRVHEQHEEEEKREQLDEEAASSLDGAVPDGDGEPMRPELIERPEVIDDFIRNFLEVNGLTRTLEAFQNEWYERQEEVQSGDVRKQLIVPDVYLQNVQLEQRVRDLSMELGTSHQQVRKIRGTFTRLKRERDYHRMHHHRVMQEKKKLLVNLKTLRKHCERYEPVVGELRRKYESTLKKKNLLQLRVDNVGNQLKTLRMQSSEAPEGKATEARDADTTSTVPRRRTTRTQGSGSEGAQAAGASRRLKVVAPSSDLPSQVKTVRRQELFPSELPVVRVDAVPKPQFEEFSMCGSLEGHTMTISALALHPDRAVVVSASDDSTWKMWSLSGNTGKLMMTGEGHREWVSGCSFHPSGAHLATCGGGGLIKIWDLGKTRCCATVTAHAQAIWDCQFHYTGNVLASCSIDHTIRLWDVTRPAKPVCFISLRGHRDSVNAVRFAPFAHAIASCSGDRTLSLWDPRTVKCVETFFGHENSVNDLTFSPRGDLLLSCDAEGTVIVWDVRMVRELSSLQVTHYPANSVAFHPSGEVFAVGSDDSKIGMYDLSKLQSASTVLNGHKDSVQKVMFSNNGSLLLSGGADSVVRMWG